MVSIYDANLPENITGQLETYRVRPEGMSLEEWYMSQGPIKPPASEIPSGPPSSWGPARQPIAVVSGGTDVPFTVTQPKIETVSTVQDIMRQKGFQQGLYGGWFKPSTQEERPIPGPVTPILKLEPPGPIANGNGGNGPVTETGEGMGFIPILLLLALGLG